MTQGRRALAGLLAVAFVLRLVPVVLHPSLNWGDEVYQTTEQAHRLVYGYGLVPWEFQVGMRSWLLPGAIAGVMAVASAIAPGPAVYLPAIAGALGVLALAPVVCAFLWCRRALGVGPALLAALVAATAPELVYFGDRALAEVLAAHVLVLGMYALLPGFTVRSVRRLALGGTLLGLVVALRLQMLPAVLVVGLLMPRNVRVAPAAAGFAGALLAGGALDAVTLGAPFASVWRYVQYNLVEHASVSFGVQPWWYYGGAELAVWGGAIPLPLALCVAGRRVVWAPAAIALVIIATHSLLGHKEQRFVYPALVMLAVQAGFGLAWAASWVTARLPPESAMRGAVTPVSGVLWAVVALTVWQGTGMRILRERVHDQLQASAFAAAAPDVCGIGMYGPGPDAWAAFGGYTHLHQNVPLFWPANATAFAADAPSFNLLLTGAMPPSGGFERQACFGSICTFRRPGSCAAHAPVPMPFPPGIAVPPG